MRGYFRCISGSLGSTGVRTCEREPTLLTEMTQAANGAAPRRDRGALGFVSDAALSRWLPLSESSISPVTFLSISLPFNRDSRGDERPACAPDSNEET